MIYLENLCGHYFFFNLPTHNLQDFLFIVKIRIIYYQTFHTKTILHEYTFLLQYIEYNSVIV